jgi:hypothetical protein
MPDQPPQQTNSEAQKNDGDPFTPPPLGDSSVPSSAVDSEFLGKTPKLMAAMLVRAEQGLMLYLI